MKFSISIPAWLIPRRIIEDLERRSKINGRASVGLVERKGLDVSLKMEDQELVVIDDDEIAHAGECAEAHAKYIDRGQR